VDRCALFVDAGYVLADGAMAVHGTRQRDSVSWDYAGLVKLLSGLSRDRTGLPVLRCYWYETVEGRRNTEHEALANLPGLKLRLGRIRPGRREGVETEMHRDLATLARNRAISDAVIVSAEEDLAEIITEVQDLGMRVAIVHIPVDGNWTISGPLREECDDIVEVSGAHLRPFVDLIAGAEPAERDEQYSNGSYPTRGFDTRAYPRQGLHNGNGAAIGAVTHQGLPAAALPAPPTIYTAPLLEDYQAAAQPSGSVAMGPGPVSTGPVGPGSHASPPPAVLPWPAAPPPPAVPAAAALPAPAPTAPAVPPPPAGPSSAADSSPQPAQPQRGGAAQQAGPSANSAQFGPGQFGPGQFGPGQPGSRPSDSGQVDPGHQGGFQPQAGPSGQAGPSVQVGAVHQALPAHQAVPAHQADHGVLAGELAAPRGSHALVAGLSGERQVPDVGRNALRAQQGAGPGRPGSHASPMAQAPVPQAPLPSPVPQSPGAADAPLRPSQPEYRPPSPDQLGARSGLPVRELPAREGAGLREGLSREAMAAPGAEAGRPPGLAASRFADASVPAPPTSPLAVPAPPTAPHSVPPSPMSAQPMPGQQMPGHQYPSTPPGHFGGGPGPMPQHQQFPGSDSGQPASVIGSGYSSPQADQGLYGGPQLPHAQVSQPVPQPMTLSLADAVQAAHAEGFGFGDAVARDAPALWLEAVLARKPRMPSDLEARLLQGSALPIDSLLHDEVRHSLRRGFWDALERSRR
jgi:hypothetical protein